MAAAFSFSLCAITIVASMSSTMTSVGSVPATLDAGMPPGSWAHTWRRTRARVGAILFRRPGVIDFSVRHTVGADATGPRTPAWWRSRDEVAAGHRLGQLVGQAGPAGQEPGHDAARVSHHADTVGRHGQTRRPRSTLHLRSAFQLGELGTSQSQVSPAVQALPCFYAPITPRRRERSGLAPGFGLICLRPPRCRWWV